MAIPANEERALIATIQSRTKQIQWLTARDVERIITDFIHNDYIVYEEPNKTDTNAKETVKPHSRSIKDQRFAGGYVVITTPNKKVVCRHPLYGYMITRNTSNGEILAVSVKAHNVSINMEKVLRSILYLIPSGEFFLKASPFAVIILLIITCDIVAQSFCIKVPEETAMVMIALWRTYMKKTEKIKSPNQKRKKAITVDEGYACLCEILAKRKKPEMSKERYLQELNNLKAIKSISLPGKGVIKLKEKVTGKSIL